MLKQELCQFTFIIIVNQALANSVRVAVRVNIYNFYFFCFWIFYCYIASCTDVSSFLLFGISYNIPDLMSSFIFACCLLLVACCLISCCPVQAGGCFHCKSLKPFTIPTHRVRALYYSRLNPAVTTSDPRSQIPL